MKIILDGCDGTGKTTLANQLAKIHLLDVCHCTAADPADYDFYRQTSRKENVVWDRHTLGELIYPKIFNRKPQLTPEEARMIIAYARSEGAKFFVLTANLAALKYRLDNRGTGREDPRIIEQLQWINDEFLNYAVMFNIPIIDTSAMTMGQIIDFIDASKQDQTVIH